MADSSETQTPTTSSNNSGLLLEPIASTSSASNENDVPNPFYNLEMAVDPSQLKTWHEMNQKVRGLIQMSDDEADDDDDNQILEEDDPSNIINIFIDDSLMTQPEESYKEPETIHLTIIKEKPDTEHDPEVSKIVTKVPSNMELTLQYLTGKISFKEFSELMEQDEENQPDAAPTSTQGTEDQTEARDENKKEETARKQRKIRRRRCDVPKHLENDMGDAILTFAQGNYELAIQQCLEIIRQAPSCSKPFQTLGSIYEDIGDAQKSLQYYLIGAYLEYSNLEEWIRLAEMCKEQNDIMQAIKCYTRAIRVSTDRLQCYWERAKLYEAMKDHKKALEGYQAVLSLLKPEESDKYFTLAWSITRSYHELGMKTKAIETINQAFKDHPDQISSEDVNLLLELLMPEKEYFKSIEILVNHCGITFTYGNGDKWSCDSTEVTQFKFKTPVRFEIPNILPIDLRVKLAICMIHMKFSKLIKLVIEPLFEEDIEETGDLYLDVAEAFMENEYYKQAEPLLKKLVRTKNYYLAAVWLRYGECLKFLGDIAGAVKAYTCVVSLAPSHIGARMSLSALQQQLGKHEEALEVLEQEDFEEEKMSREEQQMLLQKCYLLHGQGKTREFYNNAKHLLFQEWREVEAENMEYIQAIRTYKHRKATVNAYFETKGKDPIKMFSSSKNMKQFIDSLVPYRDLWEMFQLLCKTLYEKNMMSEFEDICSLGLLCPVFHRSALVNEEFEFFMLTSALITKNSARAYPFAREMVLKYIEHPAAWNVFLQVVMMSNDTRHIRFCLRRMMNEPSNVPLGIMNGHSSMASGSYKHSLGEYAHVFRSMPTDPMLSLCIGLDFFHIASQKFAAKRHYLVTQGLAFLNNYIELRGECQETYYNLGRALHQINILYVAVHYYNKVLSMPPCVQGEDKFDLRMEAAYNLSLIYESSGSHDYARYLLYKYCVI